LAPPSTLTDRERCVIVLLGHGSREQQANLDFELLAQSLRAAWPKHHLIHAYVELARPSLAEALAQAATLCPRVVVLPCFLFAAGHVKNDLPLELFRARAEFPQVEFIAANALGVHPALVWAALDRLGSVDATEGARKAMVVVGRGSSDPDANGDFAKLVRLIGEAVGWPLTLLGFIGITTPTLNQSLELLARARPDEILVLPYFLFAGRLITQIEEKMAGFSSRHPWIKTRLVPYLGLHQGLMRALESRFNEALSGSGRLPCDNCQYRVPMSPVVDNVGGLKALLWSVRHTTTHTQAMPHVYAHRSMRKHVLVCGNADCASRGSISLIGTLRRLVKSHGHEQSIRITKTACMGRCGEGPAVAIYPDGIWYRSVNADDAAELVQQHLMNDKLIARLVDAIMQ
jgi:sirohydrochlorin cobaltochelatase